MNHLDPDQDKWTMLPEMKESRAYAGCTVVGDFICMAGGQSADWRPLDSVEIFNTKTGEWLQEIPRMNQGRAAPSCASLNGELYVLGGWRLGRTLHSCEKYSLSTKTWTTIRNMESPRFYFASVTFGSKVLAIGGDDDQFLSDVEAYDEQKSQVQSKMRTGRYEHAAVVAEMPFRHLLRDEDE